MYERAKISPHHKTGRYLPHKHTSYFGLGFLLLICTILLGSVTVNTAAYQYGDPNPGPFAGSVGLSGTVKGPPPTQGATITSPLGGRFSVTPITVKGTCPEGTAVEIYKNDIFAGATSCGPDKHYAVDIDLLYGNNVLIARDYDALDQAGPDSNAVSVFYDALPPQSAAIDSSNFNGVQLLLRTSPIFRGVFPGQEFKLPIEVIGGRAPFAVQIEWGDNQTDLISRSDNFAFNATHTYAKAGSYQVQVKATDADGRSAFLTFIVIVNGKVEVLGTTTATPTGISKNALTLAWPVLILAAGMVLSFWTGERREKHVLESRPTPAF